MPYIKEMLEYNKEFVENKKYELYDSSKYPSKKIAILSCMDTRLTELLPAALNFKNGDIKIIKNAGALVIHPFGSVMRSILVSIYELAVEEILVIGHYDCGMQGLEPNKVIENMLSRGISEETLDMIRYCGVDIDNWFRGFDCVETSVKETVKAIKHHPLIPHNIEVHGFLMDPKTGRLDTVEVL